MSTRRPVAIAVSMLCLLQACATPPSATAPKAAQVEPVLRLGHSEATSAATYYQLGKFHQERGRLDAARAAYLQSIALDGRQADARNALAVIDARQGRLNDAVRLLEALVRDFPEDAYLQNNLAYVQYLRHDYSAALSALERALTIEPGNARAHANLDLVQTALIERKNTLMAGKASAPASEQQAASEDSAQPKAAAPAADAKRDAATAMAIAGAREGLAIPSAAELSRKASTLALRVPPAPAPVPVPSPASGAYSLPEQNLRVVQLQPNVIELVPRTAVASAPKITVAASETHAPRIQPEAATASRPPAAAVPAAETHVQGVSGEEAKHFRLDIANGNGIEGMAARMRKALEQRGIAVAHLNNKKPYDTAVTEIQYRAGYLHEAERVRGAMQAPVALSAVKSMPANADVRLLLGKDAGTHLAMMNGGTSLAMNDKHK